MVIWSRAIFGRHGRALERSTTARLLVPAFCSGCVALAAITPLSALEHRHWLRLDDTLTVTAERDGMPKHEYLVTRELREQILGMFE